MRVLRVWYYLLSNVGNGMAAGRQADKLFRFQVMRVLNEIGLFDFLETPRTYGQLLTEFGFVDTDYTREVFETLCSDKEKVILKENNLYRRNFDQPVPTRETVLKNTDKRIADFLLMAEGMVETMPNRLRDEPVELSESFEQNGRQMLTKFDKVLGNKIYSAMRRAAFSFLTNDDRAWLEGKHLLDVGCGSGRETAEIWVRHNGNIQITAIDPIAGMLELAEQNFPAILHELEPDHPPLNQKNAPLFKQASATKLPFPDNSFDAAFWLFVLHWTPNPRRAISECVRVVKPGGLIFGIQSFRPEINPFTNLVIRTNENCYGGFWREDYRGWFRENGVEVDIATPAGAFRAQL
ncbi:MAG: class I SAM-dependent methyltransferase [Chloroflexota bacterium]